MHDYRLISPELHLMLVCLRANNNYLTNEEVEAPIDQQAIDWSKLAQIAQKQGIAPLIYEALQIGGAGSIPSEMLTRLQPATHNIAGSNLLHLQELLRLLALLASQGIAVIPIKGPTLAVMVYGDLALRPFGDLDLLVRRQDFLQAKELLEREGYSPVTPPVCLSATQEKTLIPGNGECTLFHRERQIYVDLHWRLLAGIQLALPQIAEVRWNYWERLQAIALAGKTVNTLSDEDLLLYLCFHGAKDLWWQLKWIADIAELVGTHALDWAYLMRQSQAIGSRKMLLLGLLLAGNLLGATYPHQVQAAIQSDRQLISLATQVDRWMGKELDPWEQNLSWLAVFQFQFLLLERWSDRLRYCLAYLRSFVRPSVTDLKFFSLPRRFYWLYFFIRPLRIISQLLSLRRNENS